MKPPIDFLLDLEWTDKYEEARFLTSLSKVHALELFLLRSVLIFHILDDQ